jgi:hypothetical protein
MNILKIYEYYEDEKRIIGDLAYDKVFFKIIIKGWFGKTYELRVVYNATIPVKGNNDIDSLSYTWYVVELGRYLRKDEIRQCQWLLMEIKKEKSDA